MVHSLARFGSVLLQVSQGRQPCFKLDRRFGDIVRAKVLNDVPESERIPFNEAGLIGRRQEFLGEMGARFRDAEGHRRRVQGERRQHEGEHTRQQAATDPLTGSLPSLAKASTRRSCPAHCTPR